MRYGLNKFSLKVKGKLAGTGEAILKRIQKWRIRKKVDQFSPRFPEFIIPNFHIDFKCIKSY